MVPPLQQESQREAKTWVIISITNAVPLIWDAVKVEVPNDARVAGEGETASVDKKVVRRDGWK